METFIVYCEAGVMPFMVNATCFNTLCRTINLKNVCEIKNVAGETIWTHPSYMPFEF